MKTIGIVTVWSNNYGSVLQCYSMRKALEGLGFESEVLYQNESGINKYRHRLKVLFDIVTNSIRYPSYYTSFFKMKKSGRVSTNSLSSDAKKKLDIFVRININPVGVCYSSIRKESSQEKYKAFIAGSDQIWNGYTPYNRFAFLQFAPSDKRIAYAPSFGTDSVADYNKKKYARAIRSFSFLSARELQGVRIIRELTNIVVPQLPDPTLLLTDAEWSRFCKEKILDEQYILVHFLDKPDENALNAASDFSKKMGCKIICFSYPHPEFEKLGAILYEGDPREYISSIKNAEAVFTDSFHTSIFAIRFIRQLFVFHRQYSHGISQESRITSLLDKCGYLDRLIDKYQGLDSLPSSLHSCADVFAADRNRAYSFLREALKVQDVKIQSIPALRNIDECTGCGVCALKCPKNAIKMIPSTNGFLIPEIDISICIECGCCENYCKKPISISHDEKRVYIAFNSNEENRSKSASGGIFSALAVSMINSGGVVFGASLNCEEISFVEHKSAEHLDELYPLLQSKYVQSDESSASMMGDQRKVYKNK